MIFQSSIELGRVVMKKILILILFISSQVNAQSVDGAMECNVTGNVVVASEEGRFKTYTSIKGGVKTNEKLILEYKIRSKTVFMSLKRNQAENNTLISTFITTEKPEIIVKKDSSGGFILTDPMYQHGLSFLPDYIRIKDFDELTLSRYYKNDWHGIYSQVDGPGAFTQTITLDCRHANDKMDAAFKLFTGHLGRNK